MRYLAIDLGDKRTGWATADDQTGLVHPGAVVEIPRGDALLAALARVARETDADLLVVGLPINMDGTEGDRARLTRTFGAQLHDAAGLDVVFQDERLTSDAAERHLDGSGRTHKQKKRIRDALAAAEILRDFLEMQERSS